MDHTKVDLGTTDKHVYNQNHSLKFSWCRFSCESCIVFNFQLMARALLLLQKYYRKSLPGENDCFWMWTVWHYAPLELQVLSLCKPCHPQAQNPPNLLVFPNPELTAQRSGRASATQILPKEGIAGSWVTCEEVFPHQKARPDGSSQIGKGARHTCMLEQPKPCDAAPPWTLQEPVLAVAV